MRKVRYFLDCEFNDRVGSIDLLSIGIICEDERYFYGENSQADLSTVNYWVRENVLPYIGHHMMTYDELRAGVLKLIGKDREPELWAYNGAWDWILFVWLTYGQLTNMPKGWRKRHFELQELMLRADELGYSLGDIPNQTGQAHLAIADARWNKELFEYLQTLMMRPPTTS